MENFNENNINGAEKMYDPNSIGEKTVLIRSKMEVTTNCMLLLCLYVFGLKTVHLNSKTVLDDLNNLMKSYPKDVGQYDRVKLFGLYKSYEDRILFEGSTRQSLKYVQSYQYGGLQKLLNINEAAFETDNDLLGSLGELPGIQNLKANSILNQSEFAIGKSVNNIDLTEISMLIEESKTEKID